MLTICAIEMTLAVKGGPATEWTETAGGDALSSNQFAGRRQRRLQRLDEETEAEKRSGEEEEPGWERESEAQKTAAIRCWCLFFACGVPMVLAVCCRLREMREWIWEQLRQPHKCWHRTSRGRCRCRVYQNSEQSATRNVKHNYPKMRHVSPLN